MTQEAQKTPAATAAPAAPAAKKQHRMLESSILRYNPQDPDSVPHMQTYELQESDSMTLFIALNDLRNEQDPTLQFDFVCRAAPCLRSNSSATFRSTPASGCATCPNAWKRGFT